jgi:ectoine hydroxylase-related dioxygenase (phytanoyl-CoA dioxygenase family)
MHPLFQQVASKFLTYKQWFWEGTSKVWAVSKPQLSNTIVFSIGPGAAPQPLHRDDAIHQWVPKAIDVYPADLKRDASVGFFVAAKKATKANGATRFIPGSHLWDHEEPPNEALCQYAEMEKGDAFLMLASCFHAGSANTTTDEERLIFSSFMTRGVMRQEENQYLAVGREAMKSLPVEVQKVAGYSLSEPFLGWVDFADPMVVLDPTVKGNMDMYSGEKEPEI